jgi:hypothetical protein
MNGLCCTAVRPFLMGYVLSRLSPSVLAFAFAISQANVNTGHNSVVPESPPTRK